MSTERCFLACTAGGALLSLLATNALTADVPRLAPELSLLSPLPISSWGEFYLGDGVTATKAAGPNSEHAPVGWDFKDRFPALDRNQQATMTTAR
jgi:hypothetical protein